MDIQKRSESTYRKMEKMTFSTEQDLENHIRSLIETHITSENQHIFALKNKKAVDIIICKNKPTPELFFIEVKYHKNSHGRLGFGSRKGIGFQPEILSKKPEYFEKNLRWILSYEDSDKIFFFTNEKIRKYISNEVIGEKYNNIRKKIFKEEKGLTENEFVEELKSWLIPD